VSDQDAVKPGRILARIQLQAQNENLRVTQHAQQEMIEDDVPLDEVLQAIANAQILENYPAHKRGACCLLSGNTRRGRPLHVVCTSELPTLIIITVYEPKLPKMGDAESQEIRDEVQHC
jgi:hypothetical protein